MLIEKTKAEITAALKENTLNRTKPEDFPDSTVNEADRKKQFDLVSTEAQIIDDVLNNIVDNVVDELDSMNMVEFAGQLMAAQRGIL